jgi:hypothetical protein
MNELERFAVTLIYDVDPIAEELDLARANLPSGFDVRASSGWGIVVSTAIDSVFWHLAGLRAVMEVRSATQWPEPVEVTVTRVEAYSEVVERQPEEAVA